MREACTVLHMSDRPVNQSDGEIIGRVLGGEVDAFEELVDRYRGHVFETVSAHVPRRDVGEVAQEALVRVYLSLASYSRAGDFRHWLGKIAVRASYDYWRDRYRRRETAEEGLGEEERRRVAREIADRSAGAHERDRSAAEARSLLDWALARLSPEDRMVIELVHIEERPIREAADLLGWSVVNVKVRALRARRKLRAILEREIVS